MRLALQPFHKGIRDVAAIIEANVNDALAFTTYETGSMRKEYTGTWIGMVRPKLEWKTEVISEESESVFTGTSAQGTGNSL